MLTRKMEKSPRASLVMQGVAERGVRHLASEFLIPSFFLLFFISSLFLFLPFFIPFFTTSLFRYCRVFFFELFEEEIFGFLKEVRKKIEKMKRFLGPIIAEKKVRKDEEIFQLFWFFQQRKPFINPKKEVRKKSSKKKFEKKSSKK